MTVVAYTDAVGSESARSPVSLQLATVPTASGVARLHTRRVLARWGTAASDIDDVELVVSELVTNAARHASPAVSRPTYIELCGVERLSLTLRPVVAGVVVEVFDRDPRTPCLLPAALLDELGRGLLIVGTLSQSWGSFPVYESSQLVGKVVWALCRTTTTGA